MPILPDLLDVLVAPRVATLVDSAGHHGVLQVEPDWVATLELGTVINRRAEGTQVEAHCRPLRIKYQRSHRNHIDDEHGEVGRSICTYARLARSDNPSGTARGQIVDYAEEEESPVPAR